MSFTEIESNSGLYHFNVEKASVCEHELNIRLL